VKQLAVSYRQIEIFHSTYITSISILFASKTLHMRYSSLLFAFSQLVQSIYCKDGTIHSKHYISSSWNSHRIKMFLPSFKICCSLCCMVSSCHPVFCTLANRCSFLVEAARLHSFISTSSPASKLDPVSGCSHGFATGGISLMRYTLLV